MISVIIVNFNSGDRLARCLEHLKRQTFSDFEIIVIDNASGDDSIERARAAAPDAGYILSPSNLGFAAGNNRAAEQASGDWIAFLNPDAYAEPDWLEALVTATKRYPATDAFGSTQLMADNPAIIDGAGDAYFILGIPYRGHYGWNADALPDDGQCLAPCGAAAMYRAAVFRKLGGFDERYFCYSEDVDLGFRLLLSGGAAIQLRDARVRHEGSGVTGRYSEFTVYHGNRNRIWTTYKNLPGLLYWPLAPLRLIVDLYFCVRALTIGVGKAYFKAVVDGYAGLGALKDERRAIQSSRVASTGDVARALVWSPVAFARRRSKLRKAKLDTKKL